MDTIEKDVHDIDKRLVKIEAVLDRLENNHLSHMEKDMLKLANSLEKLDDRFFKGTIAFYAQVLLTFIAIIAFLADKAMG